MGRGKEEEELKSAKSGYKAAEREGNREEEARWANQIGDILKKRGEYVEAIRWLRIDYEVSVKYLPQKQLLPTCQSLGEVYLRLDRFRDALTYQKKHLELAKDSDDLIEQQRASTQLGRTYHEIFLRSETDHIAIRNAKKYFKLAMKLARNLKEHPPSMKATSFVKEFIDAHNNIGMLEMDLDNLEESEKFLLQGLKMCDEEELSENDDARSRLHNNLGRLYIELRNWSKAREHTEKDILICKRICHRQGEAKGFINLGELHYRVQKYDDAINCYQKALDIAKTLEDEDALVDQINQNISTVKEAAKVLEALKKDEQKLKKLTRITFEARGTNNERKCLLDQNSCLDGLIDKARTIFAWPKHREFAKRKKRVANGLLDKEKLSDSFLAIGESYQKLRDFSKARKWYFKSWNIYRSIGNLEGQALVKINIGEVLDSSGDWAGALEAFEEGHRIAAQANLSSVQISALDNMHYSHMIRFDNLEEARKLQDEINNLKSLLKEDLPCNLGEDYCSETETGRNESGNFPDLSDSSNAQNLATSKPNILTGLEESDEDIPLSTLVRRKKSSKTKMCQLRSQKVTEDLSSPYIGDSSNKCLSKSSTEHQHVGRKRAHIVVSDDEADDIEKSRRLSHIGSNQDSSSGRGKFVKPTYVDDAQDNELPSKSKDIPYAVAPLNIEESTCSFKCRSPTFTAPNGADLGSSSDAGVVVTSKPAGSEHKSDSIHVHRCLLESQSGVGSECLKFNLGGSLIYVNINSCMDSDSLNVESVKAEVACMYYLGLSEEKKSKGLLPVIKCLSYCGKSLGPLEPIEDIRNLLTKDIYIVAVLDGWVPKRLMKLYLDYCRKLSESTNMTLLKKLYNLEVSEDEVIVSDCGLQDISISPFLNALQEHKTIAVLDISHNLLGNETMEKLRQIFSSSIQKYGGLTLDLHSNRLGSTALFQICDCPVISARLEVLNLSENRLTDACSSYLSTILERCKGLYSLNIEHCSITSRTVQKLAEALHDGSVLSHLSIGKNCPISGNAVINLLAKLGSLKRFSELSLTGIKLNKGAIDSICKLARSSCLSVLMLGETHIGSDAAVRLTEALIDSPEELVKLDLSYCRLASQSFSKLCANFAALDGISELNLGGNFIGQEGCDALGSMLGDPKCNLNSLILDKCHLGLAGIICVLKALAENSSLEELHMAENVDMSKEKKLQNLSAVLGNSTTINQESDGTKMTNGTCYVNADDQELQVADSEDELNKDDEPTMSGPVGSCATSCLKNLYSGSEPIRELSDAVARAESLQLLNLSRNGFTDEAIESLYSAWSLPTSRRARKHVNKDCVHFVVEGRRCCGVKPCCRRLLN